jgi:hypothetical protein
MDNSFIADFVIILAWIDPELIGQPKGSKVMHQYQSTVVAVWFGG